MSEILWTGLTYITLCLGLGLWLGRLVASYFSEHPLDTEAEIE